MFMFIKKADKPFKWSKNLNGEFSKDDIQLANSHQVYANQNSLRCHLTSVRMAKIDKIRDSSY